jgi:hypothetical protein
LSLVVNEPNKAGGVWSRIVDQIASFIPGDMKELVGVQVAIALFAVVPMVVILGGFTLMRWITSPPAPETPCWKIEKIELRVFKLNSCTGETIEIPAK